jgi:hypothetical protein
MNSKKTFIRGTQKELTPAVIQQYGESIGRAFEAVQVWAETNLPDNINRQEINNIIGTIKGIMWQQLGQRVEELERGMDVMGKYLEDTFGDRLTKQNIISTLAQVKSSIDTTLNKRLGETYLATEQPTESLSSNPQEPVAEELVIEAPTQEAPIEGEPIPTAPRAVPVYNWNFPVEMEQGVAETLLEDYGFIRRDNAFGNISYDYSKIREKELRDGDIRQAIVTMNPNITPAELTDLATIAQKNTAESAEERQKGKTIRGIQYLEKKQKKEDSYTLVAPSSVPPAPVVEEPVAVEEPKIDINGMPIYKWEFPIEMEKGVAEALLEDSGFVNWDSDIQYDYSKIKEKDLKNDDIRQAIITVNPDMVKEDLVLVAHRNTVEAEGGKIKAPKTEGDNSASMPPEAEAVIGAEPPAGGVLEEKAPYSYETSIEETNVEPEVSMAGESNPNIVIRMKNGRALTAEEIKGAVAWKQGVMYKLVFPPYGQNDVVNSRSPFQGIVAHANARNAYETLVTKHQGKLPSTIVRHMGMMTFSVTGGNKKHGSPKVKVIEREDRKNTAQVVSKI